MGNTGTQWVELILERVFQEGNKGINREAMIVTHLAVMFKSNEWMMAQTAPLPLGEDET